MTDADFSQLDANQGAIKAKQFSAEELSHNACHLTSEQAGQLTSLLTPSTEQEWQKKYII